ncbi:MAG TPA: lytic transglycosylase domain-containing protein [Candidatus Caccocola faecipullorum]|nr:lytic transglycosylase domain-containing protein [Candidatus Caccocola faecipullorum]
MHFIPSVARDAATKIAQTAKAGKAKIFLRRCAALCALLLCVWAFTEAVYKVTAADWEAGRRAWKSGDCEAALAAWSRNAWAQPFAIRPARLYYWKIQALEKLGREDEAARAAALLALREPLDFYAFALAYEGKYPKLTSIVNAAKSRAVPARRWEAETAAASARTGVRENIIFGIMKRESKFNPDALSARGAAGLMQLMPPTAREAAQRLGDETLSPFVPGQNVMLGAAHFAYLHAKFRRRLPLAVAAYNAGAAAVSKWGADEASDWIEWIEDIPYPQTREYVRSVLENIEIYDFGGTSAPRGRRSFFAWAGLPPSLGGEFAEKRENSAQME